MMRPVRWISESSLSSVRSSAGAPYTPAGSEVTAFRSARMAEASRRPASMSLAVAEKSSWVVSCRADGVSQTTGTCAHASRSLAICRRA
jgi:hypothetical protein